MSTFEAAIGPLLKNEGSAYVPDDHGRGASKYGVTLKTYQELHPHATDDDIRNLGPAEAEAFYRTAFWEQLHLGLIDDQAVATKVLDLAVNVGGGTAIRLLQEALGIHADGLLGPETADWVNSSPSFMLLSSLRNEAAQHYRNLVLAHPEWKACLPGWLARLAQ